MTNTKIERGDIVKFGFRKGEVLRLERYHGIDGAVVRPLKLYPGDGYSPHWVPLASLQVVPQ